MADKITNYKCPACTGPLHFAGTSGNLECEYCGSSFTVKEVEDLYANADANAEAAMAAGNDEWEQLAEEWSGGEGMKVYKCPSCTAELVYDETTAATSCPYCGNPTIVPGQFSGMLKPDFIIPFKLEKSAAIQALKNHYGNKTLLPKAFKDQNHIEEIKGLYVPFWLYDGIASGDMTYEGRKIKTEKKGEYEIKTIDHYDVARKGDLKFEKIPADASSKMPDDLMDSIEPYDYSALTDFSKAYLAGYIADKYDVSAEDDAVRAVARAKASTRRALKADVTGFDEVEEKTGNVNVKQGKISYALFPVWLLNTKWNGENYMFAMNGQTGKLVGDLPEDKNKATTIFLGILAACVILGYLLFESFIGGAVVGAILAFVIVGGMKSALKSVHTASAADNYSDVAGVNVTHRQQNFIHQTTEKRKIENN